MPDDVKQSSSTDNDLAGLYGSSWFYASYYLLLKSESREDDGKTNYFYKGGKEAAELYNMVGWDFIKKDRSYKSFCDRERARRIKEGDRAGYEAVSASMALYNNEKELTSRAARLGRFLGMDEYKGKIRAFVAAEERTPWLEEHMELAVQKEAEMRVLGKKLGVDERDVLPLSAFESSMVGEYMTVMLAPGLSPEPARFLGITDESGQEMFLLEHLREIGTGWSGSGTFFKNVWDNASHDGCLEVVSVSAADAEKVFAGLNGNGSLLLGRLQMRCDISDFGRRVKANVLGNKHSLYEGKRIVPLLDVVKRYLARKERLALYDEEAHLKEIENAKQDVLADRLREAGKVAVLGNTGIERLDALINNEIRTRREEILRRYRQFGIRRHGTPEQARILAKERQLRQQDRDRHIDRQRRDEGM